MPLTTILPWILAAIVASIAAMLTGIVSGFPSFAWIASGLFSLALIATAVDVNRPWWSDGGEQPIDGDAPVRAALRNAHLVIIGYFWGALALFAMYRMTSLRWQHGLQYGAGMGLIAWLILLYAHFLARPGSRLRTERALSSVAWLSLCHGGAAFGGILFLVLSGKIRSIKDDWAANQIFLAGGIAIVALSVVSAYTHHRLSQAEDVAGGAAGTVEPRQPAQ